MKITTQYYRNLSQFSSVCAGMVVRTHTKTSYTVIVAAKKMKKVAKEL